MTQLDVSRRERKKDETRERIAMTAIRLFRERGYDATPIDEIAAAADVAKGTFFNYFPRKEAVLAHFAAAEVEPIEQLAGDRAAGSARAALFAMFQRGVESYERHRDLWRVTVIEMMRHSTPGLAEINQRVHQAIRTLVEAGQARGELRADMDPTCAANVLRGVFISTTLTWLHFPDLFELGPEMRARLELVFDGLGTGSPR